MDLFKCSFRDLFAKYGIEIQLRNKPSGGLGSMIKGTEFC